MVNGKNSPAIESMYAYCPKTSGPPTRAKSTLLKKLRPNSMHFSVINNALFFIPEKVDMTTREDI
jgi:hypothetical protein